MVYLTFTVEASPAVLEGVAPDVDGRVDIDPFQLREGIALTFNEEVDVRVLELVTGGEALQWTPTSDGSVVTLHANDDDPVVNGAEHELGGTVADASGYETVIHITFTTQLAE